MENYGFDMPSKNSYYCLFVLNFIFFVFWCFICYFGSLDVLKSITLNNFYLFVIYIGVNIIYFIGLFYWTYCCICAYREQYKTIIFNAEDYEKLIDLLDNLYTSTTVQLTKEEFEAFSILRNNNKLPYINNIFLLDFLNKYGDK